MTKTLQGIALPCVAFEDSFSPTAGWTFSTAAASPYLKEVAPGLSFYVFPASSLVKDGRFQPLAIPAEKAKDGLVHGTGPWPVRALEPGERLSVQPMGDPFIIRDEQTEAESAAAAREDRILRLLEAIAKLLGVTA